MNAVVNPEGYSGFAWTRLFNAQGEMAAYGWLSLFVLLLIGILIRFKVFPRARASTFLALAHVQILFFLLTNVAQGFIIAGAYPCMGGLPIGPMLFSAGEIAISLAIELIAVATMAVCVAWSDKAGFQPMTGIWLQILLIAADIALIVGMEWVIFTHGRQ